MYVVLASLRSHCRVPRHPIILSEYDRGVQLRLQHSISDPVPSSEGDWISRYPLGILEVLVSSNVWFHYKFI